MAALSGLIMCWSAMSKAWLTSGRRLHSTGTVLAVTPERGERSPSRDGKKRCVSRVGVRHRRWQGIIPRSEDLYVSETVICHKLQ